MTKDRVVVFANFARELAKLSKCEERKVAAIITDKDLAQIYSIGLNGGPKGLVDCMCKIDGKYGCVHAEINALIKCRSDAPDKVMFVTLFSFLRISRIIFSSSVNGQRSKNL